MQNKKQNKKKKNHRDKQMLCEALAGATLMLASTVKVCLVKQLQIPSTAQSDQLHTVLLDTTLQVLYTVMHLRKRHFDIQLSS